MSVVDQLIDEDLNGIAPESVLEARKKVENGDELPTKLLVSYKRDVLKLHRALLDAGIRPRYTYSNTSVRSVFKFSNDEKGRMLRKAYAIAVNLGIKCELN